MKLMMLECPQTRSDSPPLPLFMGGMRTNAKAPRGLSPRPTIKNPYATPPISGDDRRLLPIFN
jgi:hypothetical protein